MSLHSLILTVTIIVQESFGPEQGSRTSQGAGNLRCPAIRFGKFVVLGNFLSHRSFPRLGPLQRGKEKSSVNDSLLEAWYLPAHRFLQHVLGTQFPFLPFIFIFIYLVWSWLWHLVTAAHKLLVMVMWGLAPQLGIKPWPLPWEQSLSH